MLVSAYGEVHPHTFRFVFFFKTSIKKEKIKATKSPNSSHPDEQPHFPVLCALAMFSVMHLLIETPYNDI